MNGGLEHRLHVAQTRVCVAAAVVHLPKNLSQPPAVRKSEQRVQRGVIQAGVDKEDPRIEAAMGWISANYDLSSNPGIGSSGLYYYYHTFAKTLSVAKIDMIKDNDGKEHDWRKELIVALRERQGRNGSWTNENERWLEGDPNLVTAYALLALSHCRVK